MRFMLNFNRVQIATPDFLGYIDVQAVSRLELFNLISIIMDHHVAILSFSSFYY